MARPGRRTAGRAAPKIHIVSAEGASSAASTLRSAANAVEQIERQVHELATRDPERLAKRIALQVAEDLGRLLSVKLCTYDAVAEMFGVSRRTIENLVDAGALARVCVGSCVRISAASIENFIQKGGHAHGVDRG